MSWHRGPRPVTELDEITLVVRAQDGDLAAFEALLDQYSPKVAALCHRMLHHTHDAEDITQETLLTVWRRLGTLHDPATFRTWVFRLAANACIDMIRRRHSRRTTATQPDNLDMLSGHNPRGPQSSVEHQSENNAALKHLENVLATLPAEQRLAWLLYEVHGESYASISQILHISEGSVRGRMQRARVGIVRGMEGWK